MFLELEALIWRGCFLLSFSSSIVSEGNHYSIINIIAAFSILSPLSFFFCWARCVPPLFDSVLELPSELLFNFEILFPRILPVGHHFSLYTTRGMVKSMFSFICSFLSVFFEKEEGRGQGGEKGRLRPSKMFLYCLKYYCFTFYFSFYLIGK